MAGGAILACDSTGTVRPAGVRPAARSRLAAPEVLPARDAHGNFANPYRAYGEWHNAVLDVGMRAYVAARSTGTSDTAAGVAARAAELAMFKTNFVIDDSVAAAQALAAAQSPLLRPSDGRVRASHNADLESLLAQAHSTHALSSTEAQYLHRLGAIADASHNADELGLALQRFDQKVYTDLGPDRSAAVLIASAVLNASARYWEGRIDRGMRITTYAGPAVSGDDQICTGDCTADEGTNPTPPDSSTFYPSADGSYYYNAYADTVYIVRIDTVFVKESGGFSTQAFWLIDGISAIGGGTIATVSGCGLITAGVCSGVVALLSAIVGSSTYAVSASAPPDGGGNASGGSTATGCPTGSYAWYDSGGTYCKPYPSSVQ